MATKKNRGTDKRVAAVATAQGGIASLAQLGAAGVSPAAASRRAQRGSLHRVHRGVYAVGHRSFDRVAELRAALLACGEGAVISHGTAAAHWGLIDRPPVLIDVTVPVEAGRKIDGLRCRRCRYPDAVEIVEHDGVLCTTLARTLVDLAGPLGMPSLRRMVERAAILKLLDLETLDLAIAMAKGRRGLGGLRTILIDWRTPDGAPPDLRSEFEARVLPRLLEKGLPRPTCNQKLRIEGEDLIVDFLWETQSVVAETDGRQTHDTPVAFQRDRRRDQILASAGYRVVRVTWEQMLGEFDAVVRRIERALARG
ncbi:MAG TPA: type IV toxin-antitoxin system AbiEi family antitoxin domain-containing protein [Solirubrobacterales bacterium]